MSNTGSRVSHVFETMTKDTTCCSCISVHSSVWAQSCMCECSNYSCGSTTFHLKLMRKSQTISPEAAVSEHNVSSLGSLHSLNSIVHVMANWFYRVLQFADTDKDGFPCRFPFRSSLSLCHKQLIDHFDDVANCYLGEIWENKHPVQVTESLFISLHTPAIFGWSDSHAALHALHECLSSKSKTSLLLLSVRHRFVDKPTFWHQGEELDTIVLCFLVKESSAKCGLTVAYKVCIFSACASHKTFTCQRADPQIETKGVKNEGGLSSWRTSNSQCKQHVRVHHQNACKKTMRPTLFFTTLPEMCRNAEA